MRRVGYKVMSIVLTLAIILAVGSSVSVKAQTAGQYVQNNRWTAVQYNMFGAKGGAGYNDQVAAAVVNSLRSRSPKPWVLSFNEICSQQWAFIANYINVNLKLGGYDYSMAAHWSVPAHHDCNGGSFGNVVVVLGKSPPAQAIHWQLEHQNSFAETRGVACVYQALHNFVACSTHLTIGSSSNPEGGDETLKTKEQLLDLMEDITPWVLSGVPMFILGDFNIETTRDATSHFYFNDWWYVLFNEAERPGATINDRRATFRSFATGQEKSIDYIFVRKPGAITAPAYSFFGAYSDHAWYEGFLT